MSISDALRNEEIVPLSDGQLLRFLNLIDGVVNPDEKEAEIRKQIRYIRKEVPCNTKELKRLYNKIYELQHKTDYLCFVCDTKADYRYAYKNGVTINGKKYIRLLGTNGGIKNSTIVFISEEKYDEVEKRIENGRKLDTPLVPAKLEAYKSLVCSDSIPVSDPSGVIVVKDCITKFTSEVILLNDERDGEPEISHIKEYEIELNNSDGYGLMLPSQSQKWGEEIGEEGVVGGVCIRNSWCKGMLFTFDFFEFAKNIAGSYFVTDVWGNVKDIREATVILTESMLKLWDCYSSYEEYWRNCKNNDYTYAITKATPQELESERRLNYQFIQSYDLSEEDIKELIFPTTQTIQDSMGGDYRKSILFLKGKYLEKENRFPQKNDIAEALMICPDVIKDHYVQSVIKRMISKSILESKIGKLSVHGNFSVISGDCFALCQSIFGMKITGILQSGEIFNQYWSEKNIGRVVAYRAPMTSHNNIRLLNICNDRQAAYWFRYMKSVTVFNAWDTCAQALNGFDFDGDQVFLTDNPTLLKNTKHLPAVICIQRKADKQIVTEDMLFKSNIDSFGNEIGAITNRVTAMFDLLAKFNPHSKEFKDITYRIICGQLYQQNAIDAAKGIIAKKMPKYWYSWTKKDNGVETADYLNSISAEKKPYFMVYRYPGLKSRYKKYIEQINRKCIMEFKTSLDVLEKKRKKSEREEQFLKHYHRFMPVSMESGVINKICWEVEDVFKKNISHLPNNKEDGFDYTIYQSGKRYETTHLKKLKHLHDSYRNKCQFLVRQSKKENWEHETLTEKISALKYEFKSKCLEFCDEEDLCDILVDICYEKKGFRQFVWDMCSNTIIHNLLVRNNYKISFPVMDDSGDIIYGGEKFKMIEVDIDRDNS